MRRIGGASSRPWVGWAAIAAIATIAFVLHHDIGVFALTGAIHDDALFFRLATYIRRGEWLGPYSQMTLAKGPMLPIVVAASWWAGAAIKDVELVVYLASAAAMAVLVKRLSGSWALTIVVFAALALDPLHWDASMMRLIREPLYAALSLAVVALICLIVLDEPGPVGSRRIALAVALGLTFAAYWMTREESSWLLPAVSVTLAYRVFRTIRSEPTARRRSAASFLVSFALASGAFALGLLPVMALNWAHYGTVDTTEFRAGPFQDAYGALTRVAVEHPARFVPVPRSARERVYAVSPSAAELRPFLEGGIGRMWTDISCSAIGDAKCERDIAGGWLMWAMRDATAVAGHYRSAEAAAAFYARVAREIDSACDRGRLACSGPRHTFAPPLGSADVEPLARWMATALWIVARLEARPIGPLASPGDPMKLVAWQKGLGRVAPPENMDRRYGAGTIRRGPGEAFKLRVIDAEAALVEVFWPILWAAAVLGLGMHVVLNRRERSLNAIAALASTCLAAVVTRAFVTAYIEVTSWKFGVSHLYLAPAYGFGVVFAVCGSYLLVRAVRTLRATRSPVANS